MTAHNFTYFLLHMTNASKVAIRDLGEEEWTDVWQNIYSIAQYSLYVLSLVKLLVMCAVLLC